MNRIVLFGLTLFFSLVGIGLLGEPRSAKAFHGTHLYGGFAYHGSQRCYGHSSCHGCAGCYGCSGTPPVRSCHGCQGCHGCYGSHGCYGCHGCHGCAGAVMVPMTPAPPIPTETWTPAPVESPSNMPAAASPTSATLRVLIPDDAALLVGEFDTQSSGGFRHFQSPPLTPGKTYAYELNAEVRRDGRVIRETKTIVVKAGQTADVDFALEEAHIAHAAER